MPPRLMRGFANRGRFRQMLQRVVRDETLVYTGQCLHESLQDALQLRNDAGKFLHRPSTIQFLNVVRHGLDAKYPLAFGIDLQRQLAAVQPEDLRSYVGFSTVTSHSADFLFLVRYRGRRR